MEKNQILHEGLQHLNNYASNTMKLAQDESLFSLHNNTEENYDAVKIRNNSTGESVFGFVQPWAPQKDINTLISHIKTMPPEVILFADFVNPVMAEKFRQNSISFVDCAGNLFLNNGEPGFYITGKKPSRLRTKRVRGRAFNVAGLKLIFAIFNQPQLLNATYRDISRQVNIALGSIGPVIDDLENSGYILEEGQRRLVNKKRLFERWVDGYLEKLRPRQILSCYTSEDANWWKTADPEQFSGMWGGEVVVAKSTPFMVPETISIYFANNDKYSEFADFYGLKKDDDGEICIYKSFWSDHMPGNGRISPMIMYADIVDSINPGAWDVAKTFYGEAVADLLQDQ